MAATIFQRNQKIVAFVPLNLFFLYILWTKIMSCLVPTFYNTKLWSKENIFTMHITLAHFFYSVQVQSTYGMSVFPVATGIYNFSSTVLFAFSFRG